MSQQLLASIYGINAQSTGGLAGTSMSFPTQGIMIRPAPAGTVFNTVTMATVIQLLPAGTKVAQDQYFTPTALVTVVNAANA
jgi:hypothetical protein